MSQISNSNTLLDLYYAEQQKGIFSDRYKICRQYAFAIPDEAVLRVIVKYSPIVEIGAGTGYWAMMLQRYGANIIAFDNKTWELEHSEFFDVKFGGPYNAAEYPERSLFLCWPTYQSSFAEDCLKQYKGDICIYIGESYGGCCANDGFFELLKEEWRLKEDFPLIKWDGIRDHLWIYERNQNADFIAT